MYGRSRTLLTPSTTRAARYHAKSSKKRLPPRPQEPNPRFLQDANNVINKATRQPPGWTHTPSLRGEEKRFESKIAVLKQSAPKSIEKQGYINTAREPGSYSGPAEEGISSDKTYEVGTFVEFRLEKWTACAVIIGQVYIERRHHLICLTTDGEVWETQKDDVVFEIPNFVSPDLAESCGPDEIAANKNQLKARVEVLRHLSKFLKSVDDAANGISSLQLDVYSLSKSPDPHKWGTVTTKEVAHLMTKKPSLVTYFAAHRHMMNHPQYFIADHNFIASQRFRVRPQANLDRLNAVKDWCAIKNGPVTSFVKKARQIRDAHRLLLDERYRESPSRQLASHSWDDNDKVILQFLLDSLRPRLMNQTDVYALGTGFVCKQVMTELEKVDDTATHQLLIELGVIAPWQDLTDLREDLDLDIEGTKMKRLDAVISKSFGRPPTQDLLGPEDFYPSDPSESFRHDFGDMPVYVIDEPTASELDDGVSIEAIPSEPDAFWLHVHIADPASLIPPSHVLAKNAHEMTESVYLYHTTHHMLPPSLTHHSEYGLSLGALAKGVSRRVLTFSAKVSSNGDILDYKLRPGLVKNIIVTSYASVDAALGERTALPNLPFGDVLAPQPIKPHNESDILQFKYLRSIKDSMVQRRLKDGVYNHDFVNSELVDFKIPSFTTRPTMEPGIFTGFPEAKFVARSVENSDIGAHAIVSECMKIACRVASRYCADHNIPVLRRYATRPVASSDSAFQTILDNRGPNGYVSYSITSSRLISESVAGYSTEPREHFGNGVAEGEGYVRATSPLRRYTDLITAWQIHAHIQGKPLPFSEEWMNDFCVTLKAKERLMRRAVGLHQSFWTTLYIQRWMKLKAEGLLRDRPDPLERLFATTTTSPQSTLTRQFSAECLVKNLGIKAVLLGVDEHLLPGSTVPVELTALRLGVRPQIQATVKLTQ
ncbi:3'-5' RNA exonuclease complex component [Stygiomarasmius scandens]|uniref:3'-5' RNA exonuclease complex component n=1 Tax=Marasmiellus scandens TaxID=2682957 RepID=A0ABR1JM74_9AGAR